MVIYNQSTRGGDRVEKKKPGRPKTDKPTRDKMISLRVTDDEYNQLQELCYKERIAYIDILLYGLENWSRKQ